eukprot:scaffold136967_cov142-Phaeocystis_antarctica.AAC.1
MPASLSATAALEARRGFCAIGEMRVRGEVRDGGGLGHCWLVRLVAVGSIALALAALGLHRGAVALVAVEAGGQEGGGGGGGGGGGVDVGVGEGVGGCSGCGSSGHIGGDRRRCRSGGGGRREAPLGQCRRPANRVSLRQQLALGGLQPRWLLLGEVSQFGDALG